MIRYFGGDSRWPFKLIVAMLKPAEALALLANLVCLHAKSIMGMNGFHNSIGKSDVVD